MDAFTKLRLQKTAFGERLAQARMRLRLSQEDLAEAIGITARTVSRWERSNVIPQQYYLERLAEILLIPLDKLFGADEESQHSKLLWHIPYARNSYFTGREDILNQLHTKTQTICKHPHILSGLGGIGKTEIALEYAYRFGNDYQAILWLRSETPESFRADYLALADILQVSYTGSADQLSKEEVVKCWFKCHANWLLILDGLEDLTLLDGMFPRINQGHALITTRSQITGSLGSPIDVPKMSCVESTLFLLRRTRILYSDTSLHEIPPALYTQAETLGKLLDGHPLALDQAGAYIEESMCGLSGYLERYAMQRGILLDTRGVAASHHPETVSWTLSFCFRQIEQTSPLAADLLRLCAFLPFDPIPEDLLTQNDEFSCAISQSLSSNPLLLDELVKQLRRFSLLHREATTRTLHIHRLLQVIIQDKVDDDERNRWIAYATRIPQFQLEERENCS